MLALIRSEEFTTSSAPARAFWRNSICLFSANCSPVRRDSSLLCSSNADLLNEPEARDETMPARSLPICSSRTFIPSSPPSWPRRNRSDIAAPAVSPPVSSPGTDGARRDNAAPPSSVGKIFERTSFSASCAPLENAAPGSAEVSPAAMRETRRRIGTITGEIFSASLPLMISHCKSNARNCLLLSSSAFSNPSRVPKPSCSASWFASR